ncbi:gliding motility-associated C-terminal domain-containing protein [Taibaiella chishuiensis]|uniref:Gliding motility-associated-like protein n=1 Tax=Taibaiella chishuiensis TaxID=1434707 RepID=A0A2P8D4E0_9BACT|nr:gliding motility-associated C-terminal domain-containing protein [Taibaiella chishuiensis]PSK92039.1 gliding motility-associated-like protein [Taibaiella chishuiensis]
MKKLRHRHLLLLLVCCLLLGGSVGAQPGFMNTQKFLKANSMWALGDKTGLNFNVSPPATFTSALTPATGGMNIPGLLYVLGNDPLYGTSSVADRQGQMLFYTDGVSVYNANNLVMPNGAGLKGGNPGELSVLIGNSTLQSTCVVPFPKDTNRYYVFVLNAKEDELNIMPDPLTYSIVDMRLDNNKGNIVTGSKNLVLDTNALSGAMIAVQGSNCDVWLLVHEYGNPVFKAYHITEDGLDPNPVLSTTGNQLQGPAVCNIACSLLGTPLGPTFSTLDNMAAYGTRTTMSVAPNGRLLSVANFVPFCLTGITYGVSGVLLCKFDPATGVVSDGIVVDENLQTASVAFSPDNSKLYMVHNSVYDSLGNGTAVGFPIIQDMDSVTISPYAYYQLLQYDVSSYNATTITGTKTIIDDNVKTSEFSTLRLYNDKIYVNNDPGAFTRGGDPTGSSVWLGVIDKPDAPGLGCAYNPKVIPLPDKLFYTFPNQVVFAPDPDTTGNNYKDTLVCSAHLNGAFPEGVVLTAASGFDSCLWDDGSRNPVRSITGPGKYWVINFDRCHSRTDTFIVRHIDISFDLKDVVSCYDDSVKIDVNIPDPGSYGYQWSTGATEGSTYVKGSDPVWVKLTKESCEASDTAKVHVYNFKQDLGENKVFCMNDEISFILNANIPQGAPGVAVRWSTGDTDPSIRVTDTGTYTVVVRSEFCSGAGSMNVSRELCECYAVVPNAFTPNSDGLNDVFQPVVQGGCLLAGGSLRIFNRYGQLIYNGDDILKGWDGMHNGKTADVGTYFYELSFEAGTHHKKHYYKGSLSLVK